MATVRRRSKHESIGRMLREFNRRSRRDGTSADIRKNYVNNYYLGPSKKRQLKSKNARKRSSAIRRRNRRRHRIQKSRFARHEF